MLSDLVFYRSGESGVSSVVGVESKKCRIARYTLRTGAAGASRVELSFTENWKGAGTTPELFYFYIGTDPQSHANADPTYPRTGAVNRLGTTCNYTGQASVVLLPNTTYYLWLFPATTTFGWVQWTGVSEAQLYGALASLEVTGNRLGEEMTLSIAQSDPLFHSIQYEFGEESGTICENCAESVHFWTPPLALARQIPESGSGVLTFLVTTWENGISLGSHRVEVEVFLPEDILPTAQATWEDISGAMEQFGAAVQLVSELAVTVSGTGIYGSAITSAAVTLNGRSFAGGALKEAGDVTLCATVTDSRGRTGTREYTLTVLPYATPTVKLNASRCRSDGEADDMGDFALVTVSGTVSSLAGQNRALLSLQAGTERLEERVEGEFQWSRVLAASSVTAVTLTATVTDLLMSSPKAEMVLSIGYATVDYFRGGRGIAFGTTAQQEGFTCAMATDHRGFPVVGLPEPQQDDAAATKAYVDAHSKQGRTLTLAANEAVRLEGAEEFVYITSKTSGGDIFLKVNGKSPDSCGYTFPGSSSNFTGGQVGYSGSSYAACVLGKIRCLGGHVLVSTTDLRGNHTGCGRGFLIWRNTTPETISLSAAGSISLV